MTKPLLEFKGFLSFLLLHEISRKSLCGEDLAKRIGRRKGGEPLTPGTVYPALKELRELGLVTYVQFGRKKLYSLTKEGESELSRQYALFSRYFYGLKKYIRRPRRRLRKRSKKQ
ncbi:MAG: PadR family transcriptional regulator [Candidatus Woesearchaeota archaeon]